METEKIFQIEAAAVVASRYEAEGYDLAAAARDFFLKNVKPQDIATVCQELVRSYRTSDYLWRENLRLLDELKALRRQLDQENNEEQADG